MKKLFLALLALVLALSISVVPVFALEGEETVEIPETIEGETVETEEDTATEPENLSKTPENEILEQILGFVSKGEIWGKIGATVLSILALIFALRSSLNKIHDALVAVNLFISGKATKEETEKAVKEAREAMTAEYEKKHKELKEQNAELAEKYDKMQAILSLTVIQVVKSPNARTQIMQILNDTKKITGDIHSFVESVTEDITKADAETPKQDTPALDSIVEEHKEENIIRLG